MTTIHPSAIVDPRAQLADDVQIGPGCILDGPVEIGAGTRLIAQVYLHGRVVLGVQNVLYPNVCVGFEPQDRKFTPAKSPTAGVLIGDRNLLREGVTIHSASQLDHPTTLGNDNFMMTNVHIGHDILVGNQCTLASGAIMAGHARLFDQVNLGGGAGVHQFCRLGRLSFLGGISATSKDLPPFTVASGLTQVMGLNLVGLRRNGASHEAIDELTAGFNALYLEGHTNPVAVALIEELAARNGPGAPWLRELAAFVKESQRGLAPHAATATKQKMQR